MRMSKTHSRFARWTRSAAAGAAVLGLAALVGSAGAAHHEEGEAAPEPAAAPPAKAASGSGSKTLAEIDAYISKQGVDTKQAGWKQSLSKPPKLEFDKGKSYFWKLETSEGPIKIKLMPDVAPMHVSSTIFLTRLGFYDNTVFHRVITGFMAQGGDPTGTGRGGPGYKYGGEFNANVRHTSRGLLSMANAGPGTDGSQFFLTFQPTAWLDGKHTIFGKIVEGDETLGKIEALGSRGGRPSAKIMLEKATILVE